MQSTDEGPVSATATGTESPRLNRRAFLAGTATAGGPFVRSQTITLVAGHVYRAYIYLTARAGRRTAFTHPPDWEGEKYFPTASATGWVDKVTVRF